MSYAMSPSPLPEALQIIRAVPGYTEVGVELAQLASENRIRFDPALEDRAQAGLLGVITLGPEAMGSSSLSLAQTLVHEHFHLRRQNPFLKTLSFWSGIASGTPVMKRYEQPAYQAAHDFLEVVKRTKIHLANEADNEQRAIRQVFNTEYGGHLSGS
jgi:hypothetical protein